MSNVRSFASLHEDHFGAGLGSFGERPSRPPLFDATSRADVTMKHQKKRPPAKAGKRKVRRSEGMPKQPLSAYNIFFKYERKAMMEASDQTSRNDGAKTTSKRKIGFSHLAKTIAAQWKVVDNDRRSYFQGLADEEQERYKKEMVEWKRRKKMEKAWASRERRKELDAATPVSFSSPGPQNGWMPAYNNHIMIPTLHPSNQYRSPEYQKPEAPEVIVVDDCPPPPTYRQPVPMTYGSYDSRYHHPWQQPPYNGGPPPRWSSCSPDFAPPGATTEPRSPARTVSVTTDNSSVDQLSSTDNTVNSASGEDESGVKPPPPPPQFILGPAKSWDYSPGPGSLYHTTFEESPSSPGGSEQFKDKTLVVEAKVSDDELESNQDVHHHLADDTFELLMESLDDDHRDLSKFLS